MMDLGLEGKVAIVTGASRGIGRGIALGLAQEGCRVAICARGAEPLADVGRQLRETGSDVLELALDLTQQSAPQQLVDATVERFGGIDVVVNNVGGNCRKPLVDTTDEDWQNILELNFLSHVRTSRAAIPHLQKAGRGAILLISSIFGREAGGPGLAIYNSTKSAVISLAKIMALELASQGIRVNSIAPGSIRFPGGSWDRRVQSDPEGMKRFVAENLPIGRFGTVEEVANVALFLASPRASLVTGACLNVDGGQSHSLI